MYGPECAWWVCIPFQSTPLTKTDPNAIQKEGHHHLFRRIRLHLRLVFRFFVVLLIDTQKGKFAHPLLAGSGRNNSYSIRLSPQNPHHLNL